MASSTKTYVVEDADESASSGIPPAEFPGTLAGLLDAAVEMAWLHGIVVVVAAGNGGADTMRFPPANDPYVITVGATDDAGTVTTSDDTLASFSAYGTTQDGFAKPDLVAPGIEPSEHLNQREMLALVFTALRELPDEMSEVLSMVAVDEISYQEVANRLGIPLGTVRSRVSRARAGLRSQLEKAGVALAF